MGRYIQALEDGVFVKYSCQVQLNSGVGPCEALARGRLGMERVREEQEQGSLEQGGPAQEELERSSDKRRMSSFSSDSSEYRALRRVKQELLDDAGKSRSISDWDTMQYTNKTI